MTVRDLPSLTHPLSKPPTPKASCVSSSATKIIALPSCFAIPKIKVLKAS